MNHHPVDPIFFAEFGLKGLLAALQLGLSRGSPETALNGYENFGYVPAEGRTDAEVVSVGLSIDWRDVGGFVSLAELLATDADGNAVDGAVVTLDSTGCVLINAVGPRHVVSAIGLRDHLVVATPTATLVAPLADSERVKELVALVRTQRGDEFA